MPPQQRTPLDPPAPPEQSPITSLTEIIQAGRVGGSQPTSTGTSGAPRPANTNGSYPTSGTFIGPTLPGDSRRPGQVLAGILLGNGTGNVGATPRADADSHDSSHVPEPYSPVAAALAETRNAQRQARATAAQADYSRQSHSHQYGAPGVVRVSNQFTEMLNSQQQEAARTTFDVLSLPSGLDADATYAVGTSSESLARYRTGVQGTKAMKDQAAANGRPVQNGRQEGTSDTYGDVQDLRAGGQNASQAQRPTAVINTIAGGIAQFQQMSVTNPDAYNSMVYRLWQAGLAGNNLSDAGLGGWTAGTGKALANAMAAVSQLNAQGLQITLDEYLDNLANARGQAMAEEDAANGGGGGVATPAPRSYTSREELNARLKSTAQEVLGRALSDDEADRFASAFRGTEDAAYNKAEADQDYENPNAGASAQSFVEDNNETEAASFRIQGFMERLKSEMGL